MTAYLGALISVDGFKIADDDLELLKELAESRREHASYAQLLLTGYYDVHFYPQVEDEKEHEKKLISHLDGGKNITVVNKDELSVYPNPSGGTINLETSERSIIQNVEVYSLYGSKLPVSQASNNSNKITIENLPPGVYFVRCRIGNEYHAKKVVVQW
jgi:hypothetical protein